ncbi:hypothetical protein CB0940_00729 [Cercospora beticola]|uniref:Uncharacterized protein n=1 Tax=Cercospora beticola TaxID=122368 RepID=A0A2G5IBM3_CERBT|nr:hypothetical protein CB0940_00729 [Cercospora beticola]PIB02179.1 hypothetical protein CB0940_00729 [Cercospora beticola]
MPFATDRARAHKAYASCSTDSVSTRRIRRMCSTCKTAIRSRCTRSRSVAADRHARRIRIKTAAELSVGSREIFPSGYRVLREKDACKRVACHLQASTH